jgi:hypothetical protein
MGKVKMALYRPEDINWDARHRVEMLSVRPAPPELEHLNHHDIRRQNFWSAMFCLGMAVALVATWMLVF